MGRTREVAARLLLAAAAALGTLLAVEAAFRLLGISPERYLMTARLANARWTLLLDCYPTNPRGYFDLDLRLPASRERYFAVAPLRYDAVARRAPWAVEFRYNALRFRDAPLGPKPPGVRRVMVLGDSFAEGQGVKEPDTLAKVLERLLDEGEPGRWEVRNCGRRGEDFPALYEAFLALLPHEPDLVVYALTLNDAERTPEFQARQSYLNDWIVDRARQFEDEGLVETDPLGSRLLGFVKDRVQAVRVGRRTTRWYREMWDEANRAGRDRTFAHLREMDRLLRERRARLLVAPWPLFVGLERGYPFEAVHDRIARFCLGAGIAHHDLLPAFRGRPGEELWVHPVDHHPNERAHLRAAQALAPVVERLLR